MGYEGVPPDIEEIERRQHEHWARMIGKWDEACERVFFSLYLALQDAGVVEPYYDPASLCSNTQEEWEAFQ